MGAAHGNNRTRYTAGIVAVGGNNRTRYSGRVPRPRARTANPGQPDSKAPGNRQHSKGSAMSRQEDTTESTTRATADRDRLVNMATDVKTLAAAVREAIVEGRELDRPMVDLRTAVTQLDDAVMWRSVEQIADRWRCVSVQRAGQIVTLLGLRSAKSHRREREGVIEYSPAAVGLIERELQSRGYSRKAES